MTRGLFHSLLASTSDDGVAAWRQFVRGVEAHVSGQQSLLPLIGGVLVLVGIMAFNLWLARRVVSGPGEREDSPADRAD
ncbi:MAG: hypothetical protein ACIARR_06825 [Phycisphaerales bacterium JB059]